MYSTISFLAFSESSGVKTYTKTKTKTTKTGYQTGPSPYASSQLKTKTGSTSVYKGGK